MTNKKISGLVEIMKCKNELYGQRKYFLIRSLSVERTITHASSNEHLPFMQIRVILFKANNLKSWGFLLRDTYKDLHIVKTAGKSYLHSFSFESPFNQIQMYSHRCTSCKETHPHLCSLHRLQTSWQLFAQKTYIRALL